MIPFLIYILFKRHSTKNWEVTRLQINKFFRIHFYIIFCSLLVLLFLIPILSTAQHQQLNYKIVQGGDDIGWLRLEKYIAGNRSNLLLISEIKTRILFLITVSAKELSTYENGKLIYSSQFRKTNGSTKLDKQTRFAANKYEVLENGERINLSIPFIGTNLLSLYFQEPLGITQVYCDNYKCFTGVTKMVDGGYKVKFPDGNSNRFYYNRGVCTKVKISHTFYSAEIILKS